MLSIKIRTSSTVSATVDSVWDAIRDFNDLPKWYPSVIKSYIEEGISSDTVGCVRQYEREDGLTIRERLLGLNDCDRTVSYALLQPNEPMKNYIATMRLLPVTDGNLTYVEWFADFDCDPEQGSTLQHDIEQVFLLGFKGLKSIFDEQQ